MSVGYPENSDHFLKVKQDKKVKSVNITNTSPFNPIMIESKQRQIQPGKRLNVLHGLAPLGLIKNMLCAM